MSKTGFILLRESEPKDGDCIKAKLKDSSEFVHKKFGDIIDRNVFDVALEYIEQLESAQPKWISVEERLPGEFVDVLLYGDSRGIAIGSYDANDGYFWKREDENTLRSVNATHWMPLPELPKEEM